MRALSDVKAAGVVLEQLTDLPTPVGQPGIQASTDFMRQVRRTWRCTFGGRAAPGASYRLAVVAAPTTAEDSYAVSVTSPTGKVVCEVVWLKQGDFVVRLDIGGDLKTGDAAQRYSDLAITALKRALA